MFMVKFDFDFEAYKKDIEKYKRQNDKPYHFTQKQRDRVVEACRLVARLSPVLARPGQLRNRLVGDWFNTPGHAGLFLYLIRLDNFIKDSSRAITFADGSKRHLKIKMNPDNIDAPPVWRKKPMSDAKMQYAGAWVFPLPGTGAPRQPSEYHVGSGIRILLGRAYPFNMDKYERAGVIYHELTHKLIGTNDHQYGTGCKGLSTHLALKNADNYNFFFQEFGRQWDSGLRA